MATLLFLSAFSQPKPVVVEAMQDIGFERVHTINLQSFRQHLDSDKDEDEILHEKLKADVLQVFDLSMPNNSVYGLTKA